MDNIFAWIIGFLLMVGSSMAMATGWTYKITGTFIFGMSFFLLGVVLLMYGILC